VGLLIGAVAGDVTRLLTFVAGAVVRPAAEAPATAAAAAASGRLVPTIARQMAGFATVEAAATAAAAASTAEATASSVSAAAAAASVAAAASSAEAAASSVSAAAASVAAAASLPRLGALGGSVSFTPAVVANHRGTGASKSASSATSAAPLRAISTNVALFTATVARSIAHLR